MCNREEPAWRGRGSRSRVDGGSPLVAHWSAGLVLFFGLGVSFGELIRCPRRRALPASINGMLTDDPACSLRRWRPPAGMPALSRSSRFSWGWRAPQPERSVLAPKWRKPKLLSSRSRATRNSNCIHHRSRMNGERERAVELSKREHKPMPVDLVTEFVLSADSSSSSLGRVIAWATGGVRVERSYSSGCAWKPSCCSAQRRGG